VIETGPFSIGTGFKAMAVGLRRHRLRYWRLTLIAATRAMA
jgi:hypothetical protein